MEIPGLHPSLQLALVLANSTWPMELQKEPRSSLLFHQSITSLLWGDFAYSLATRSSWGRRGGTRGEAELQKAEERRGHCGAGYRLACAGQERALRQETQEAQGPGSGTGPS